MTLASVTSSPSATATGKPSTVANPETLSAEELHRACLTAFRVGNRSRYKFARALATLHATKLYLKLGYSSVAQYAEAHFGYQRSRTFECLRVAKALEDLAAVLEMRGLPENIRTAAEQRRERMRRRSERRDSP